MKYFVILLIFIGFFVPIFGDQLSYSPTPEPEQDIPVYTNCGEGTTYQDGVCVVDKSQNTTTDSSVKWGVGLRDSKFESPLKQFKENIPFYEIKCNNGFQLTQKHDGTPACVKSETAIELIKRGWVSDIILAVQSWDVFPLNSSIIHIPKPEMTSRYEKYLDENNELNFAQPYDNNGMIIDDLQRIYDWCDYHDEKPDWYFEWNNQTHHIDSRQCKWYGCYDGEIYYRGVCMTPETKEKAQSVGKLENEN